MVLSSAVGEYRRPLAALTKVILPGVQGFLEGEILAAPAAGTICGLTRRGRKDSWKGKFLRPPQLEPSADLPAEVARIPGRGNSLRTVEIPIFISGGIPENHVE